MYRYVIFDLDGTLVDSRAGIVHSLNFALESCGYPRVNDDRELSWFVGPPLQECFRKLGVTDDSSVIERLVAAYSEDYASVGMYESSLYPGTTEVLHDLFDRGIVLILATSKLTAFAEGILQSFELDELFGKIIGSDMDGSTSTKDEQIGYVMGAYGGPASGYILVGDRGDDIVGARRNGIDSIGVLYGYGGAAEISESGPTHLAKDIEDVRAILLHS